MICLSILFVSPDDPLVVPDVRKNTGTDLRHWVSKNMHDHTTSEGPGILNDRHMIKDKTPGKVERLTSDSYTGEEPW